MELRDIIETLHPSMDMRVYQMINGKAEIMFEGKVKDMPWIYLNKELYKDEEYISSVFIENDDRKDIEYLGVILHP